MALTEIKFVFTTAFVVYAICLTISFDQSAASKDVQLSKSTGSMLTCLSEAIEENSEDENNEFGKLKWDALVAFLHTTTPTAPLTVSSACLFQPQLLPKRFIRNRSLLI